MADITFQLTPHLRAMLDRMGVSYPKVGAATLQQLSGGMSRNYAPISWDPKTGSSDPYFALKARGITLGDREILTSPRVQQQVETASKKRGVIDPSVMKLYQSVLSMRQVEAARGAPDTSPHNPIWSKGLELINRIGLGVTTGMYEGETGVEQAQAQGKSWAGWRGFDEFGHGFVRGITGKPEAKTGAQYMEDKLGVHNKVGKFAGGLAIDILADPISYVPFGIAAKLGKAAQVAKVARTEEAALDITKTMKAGPALSKGFEVPTAAETGVKLGGSIGKPLTPTAKAYAAKAGVAHIDKLSTIVGAQAGKSAQVSIADDLIKLGFTKQEAKNLSVKWLNPKYANDVAVQNDKRLYGDLIKMLPGMQSVKFLDKALPNLVNDARMTATKQLTEVLNANLEQEIRRTLVARPLGFEIPLAPIPQGAVKAMDNLAKTPYLGKAIQAFDRGFNTGSKWDHDLYITKSRSAGKAEQQINLGRDKLVNGFRGIGKDQRVGYMNALMGHPASYGRGVVTLKDGRDMADLMQEVFGHIGSYIDWSGRGLGTVSIHKLNQYLPNEYKFDESIIRNKPDLFNAWAGKGSQNFLNLLAHSNRDVFSKVDPQDLGYHLYIGMEKVLNRDRVLRAIGDMGIPIKAANLSEASIGKEGNNVAQQLVAKHGYVPFTREVTDKALDPSMARYVEGKVFHPEIKAGLDKMMRIVEDENTAREFLRGYDRVIGYWKKSVTLPSIGYHIRNSVGDFFTSFADGVQGLRGSASYAQAAKVMRVINPVSKMDEVKKILEAPATAANTIEDPMQKIAEVLGATKRQSISGNLVMKKNPKWKDIPGKYVSAEQFMAAYQHMGLKRGFAAADLERELRGNPNLFMKGLHWPMDQVVKLSQSREDYFRMAHFIDRIKRSKAPTFEEAAKEAAYYVKKAHFDYTDITPFERTRMARMIPFYKFQRFATPLMLQIFFAHPGKLLSAQKLLNNLAYAQGYTREDTGGFLPTADMIMPEYMRDAMMIPLFEEAGITVFGAGAGLLPSTSIFAQTLGLSAPSPGGVPGAIGRNIVQSATPAAQIPAELFFHKKVLGKGQIPITSQKDYWFSKNPVANTVAGLTGITSGGGTSNLVRFLNSVTGLGLSENTPARQKSELLREKDVIAANRKKSGYVKPKEPSKSARYGYLKGG